MREPSDISGIADQALRMRRSIKIAPLPRMLAALQSASVEFVEDNGGGPCVRLKKLLNGDRRRPHVAGIFIEGIGSEAAANYG